MNGEEYNNLYRRDTLYLKVEESGSILRKPGSHEESKWAPEILPAIDHQMEVDDETSLSDLKSILEKEGVQVSITTIHRW